MTFASSKGQLGFEGAWVIIVLVILAIGLLMGYGAFKDLNDDIQADLDLSTDARAAAQTVVGNYPANMDNMFFFFFVMLWVFLVIGAYLADTSPVFLVITILLIVFGLVVGMILSNTYEEVREDGTISTFANEFPKMNWLMDHILITMIFMGFSVMMVLYARSRS